MPILDVILTFKQSSLVWLRLLKKLLSNTKETNIFNPLFSASVKVNFLCSQRHFSSLRLNSLKRTLSDSPVHWNTRIDLWVPPTVHCNMTCIQPYWGKPPVPKSPICKPLLFSLNLDPVAYIVVQLVYVLFTASQASDQWNCRTGQRRPIKHTHSTVRKIFRSLMWHFVLLSPWTQSTTCIEGCLQVESDRFGCHRVKELLPISLASRKEEISVVE